MNDQDLLRCPLLKGLDRMHRAELIGLLNDSGVREKLEQCLAEHISAQESTGQAATVCAGEKQPGDFDKQVHTWNPQRSPWNRSPKE
ncbi:MAG TPA: hypothetical protein VK395_21265 [Gemmataceae bacterium]|nr:hypothetical protein [Gemmataceae bacterium]